MIKNFNLISFTSFKGYNFYIPDYQRGYRWTNVEVNALLNDLFDYFSLKTDRDKVPYYCMQPLVVYARDESGKNWEVLDGQQRLTTFFLLMKCLKNCSFSIEFQTRPKSKTFLEEIGENPASDESKSKDNIDYYHILNAYKCITEYLNKDEKKDQFIHSFSGLSLANTKQDIKYIWYDVSQEVKETPEELEEMKSKIFSRLNIGKIGLTNAELVKALLFSRIDSELSFYFNDENKRKVSIDAQENILNELSLPLKLRINSDWDMIEHELHDENFWAFIYGDESKNKKYDTRIEFILDNVSGIGNGRKNQEDKYSTLNYFKNELQRFDIENEDLKTYNQRKTYYSTTNNTVETIWKRVMDLFYTYKNWFMDRYLYHLVGVLRYLEVQTSEIQKVFDQNNTVEEFKSKLKEEALRIILNKNDPSREIDIDNLTYRERNDVKNVLVLFNVFTSMKNSKSDLRFSFKDLYGQQYDIEHVYSQTPKDITGKDRTDWIDTCLEYFSGVERVLDGEKIDIKDEKDFLKEVNNKLPELKEKLQGLNITNGELCKELLEVRSKKSDLTKESVYTELSTIFNLVPLDDDTVNNISNLVLLDQGTNRGYKNAFFPVKRKWIVSREKHGIYMPLCTKNVFMKSYSTNLADLMNWTKSDADSYINVINETIEGK